MTVIEIAQRTREFSGFARNCANDRDGYRVVKMPTPAILSRERFSQNNF
jgi:hypothetical protein